LLEVDGEGFGLGFRFVATLGDGVAGFVADSADGFDFDFDLEDNEDAGVGEALVFLAVDVVGACAGVGGDGVVVVVVADDDVVDDDIADADADTAASAAIPVLMPITPAALVIVAMTLSMLGPSTKSSPSLRCTAGAFSAFAELRDIDRVCCRFALPTATPSSLSDSVASESISKVGLEEARSWRSTRLWMAVPFM